MNHDLYYDGRQIKNYLVGFASIFSEIPYRNRKGKIDSVPIYYGSPSDIISFLETNVDNEETSNRNRLKDITVPLFSFRMTSIERNLEKRRAPLDSITVDLRSLGYSTGYTTMQPSPFQFTFELLLWASSDYQAFEIVEQIVPYFNSPQQVTIEPLPKCPVSTTEVFLESFEIDTEPDSQKYSALVTMSFNLTGWLLSQPRIWSSNMKFELSMLDKDNINKYVKPDNTDYSVGHEIIDNNTKPRPKTAKDESLETVENFILKTDLSKVYGEKLDWYKSLVKAGRISPDNGQILDTTPLVIEYKGKEKTLFKETMDLLIDDMEDVKYLFTNEKLKKSLQKHDIKDDISILTEMFEDNTDSINIFLTLLDNNLITKGFNRTSVPISNSDKLSMFGTPRVDIDLVMDRMKSYLAGIENIKLKKSQIESINNFKDDFSIFIYDIKIPLESIPSEFKMYKSETLDYSHTEEFDILKKDYDNKFEKVKLHMKSRTLTETELSQIKLVTLDDEMNIITKLIDISYNFDSTFDIEIKMKTGIAKPFNLIPIVDKPGFNIKGIYVKDNKIDTGSIEQDIQTDLEKFNLFDKSIPVNKNIIFDSNYFEIFDQNDILNTKFLDMDSYVIASLLYTRYVDNNVKKGYSYDNDTKLIVDIIENDKLFKIFNNKFDKNVIDMIKLRNNLFKTIKLVVPSIKNLGDFNEIGITKNEIKSGQKTIAPDLAVTLSLDKNGKPIYDANRDGFIDEKDLKLLDSNVDNPSDYDFENKYGIWYKRFRIEDMTEERIKRVSANLKVIYYLTEKDNMDELKDYLILWDKGLLSDGFDIFPDKKKQKEIMALGFDLNDLDDKLLFFRLFASSIKNIMIDERDFILYNVPDMNEESKEMLYQTEGLNIDKIVMAKFIERYFKVNIDEDSTVIDKKLFTKILPDTMGEYFSYAESFNLMWYDIKHTDFFRESLTVSTPWLDDQLPEISERINNILKKN